MLEDENELLLCQTVNTIDIDDVDDDETQLVLLHTIDEDEEDDADDDTNEQSL